MLPSERDDVERTEEETAGREQYLEGLSRELRDEREKAQSYLANWQRSQADLENYRRRVQQERSEVLELASGALLGKLLGALDDLDRAFARPSSEMRRKEWVEGARLGFEKLMATLESEGLSPIDALGKPFDPRYHDAIMRRSGDDGMVLEEVRKGYTLNGRVLRPSMVVVGTAEHGDSEGHR